MQLARAIERLGAHMDEPLGDPAVLPTFLLAEEARRHVKVMLGGEGADELFGGYPTYLGHRAAAWYARCPAWLRRRVLEPTIRAWPSSDHKVTFEFLLKRFVNHAAEPLLERHGAWFGVLPSREAAALAGPRLRDASGSPEPVTTLRGMAGAAEEWNGSELAQVMYVDALSFLAEGLLTKLDRVCMSCSLESRSPYLGRDVVELAAALPASWKVRGLQGKWILREATRDLVPRDFLTRRKRGLSVPLARMFRHELRATLLDELAPARLDAEGLIDGRAAAGLVADHLEHRADRSRSLWAILSLVRWYRNHALRTPSDVREAESIAPVAAPFGV
jgi:asparagine synthase (glutamine-hydrolysing)